MFFIVPDCLEGGDMYELLNKRERLTEIESQLYIAEIIPAIEHVHKVGTLSHCNPLQYIA
jgi:serine/threonine protein kinase